MKLFKHLFLVCLLLNLAGVKAQVKDINEATKLLTGGWDLTIDIKKGDSPLIGRDQIYFYSGDSCYRRVVEYYQVSDSYCNSTDTSRINKWIWKPIGFNKRKQTIKISMTLIKSVLKPSCFVEPHTMTMIFVYEIESEDKISTKERFSKQKKFFIRKKDQVNYSPR